MAEPKPTRSVEARALDLVERAMDQPSDRREAWIRTRRDAEAVRTRALALLDGSRRAASMLPTGGAPGQAGEAPRPERIGAYRVTGLIGQGGMGAVYRGERAAGDFDHTVAIKVIRPGALSGALIERFRRERQTLARLAHPNIARLFDGGETAAGEPYIVMEFVEGRPLSEWLADERPSEAERQALFLGVAAAVTFAHQNLIVHGDVTPANILVDAEGRPRLIDFGISRPADPTPEDPAQPGGAGAGTPGYAAPERLAGTPATTLSDVYSLGRLLEALFDAPRPADLTAIVARATATDPAARYPTANALAQDVAAWRDGMPVAARDGGRWYVLRRFVRRHRLAVGASAAALGLLVGAFGVASWSYVRAEDARRVEAQRFDQVREIARYMIFDLNGRLAQVAGNTEARASIAAEAQRYLDNLAATPRASADLRHETARGLIRLARVLGAPAEPNLGDTDGALRNLDKAERLLATLPASSARDVDQALAKAYRGVILLHAQGRQKEGAPLIEAADAAVAAVPARARDAHWIEARRLTRRASLELADVGDRRDEIPALATALVRDQDAWPPALRRSRVAVLDATYALYYRALHASGGDLPKAVELYLETERGADRLLAETPNDPTVLGLATWAAYDGFAAASQLGREDISHRLIEKARVLVDRLRAVDARDRAAMALSANIREALAQDLRDRDRFAEAIALQAEVVAARRRAAHEEPNGRSRGNLGFSLAIQGVIAKNAGRRPLACASWREAEAVLAQLDAAGTIVGFHKGFLPGLRRANSACADGTPLAAIPLLRD